MEYIICGCGEPTTNRPWTWTNANINSISSFHSFFRFRYVTSRKIPTFVKGQLIGSVQSAVNILENETLLALYCNTASQRGMSQRCTASISDEGWLSVIRYCGCSETLASWQFMIFVNCLPTQRMMGSAFHSCRTDWLTGDMKMIEGALKQTRSTFAEFIPYPQDSDKWTGPRIFHGWNTSIIIAW